MTEGWYGVHKYSHHQPQGSKAIQQGGLNQLIQLVYSNARLSPCTDTGICIWA